MTAPTLSTARMSWKTLPSGKIEMYGYGSEHKLLPMADDALKADGIILLNHKTGRRIKMRQIAFEKATIFTIRTWTFVPTDDEIARDPDISQLELRIHGM